MGQNSILGMLLSRPATDAFLSRRTTWDGQIVHVTDPNNPDYGKYFRVVSSYRNDDGDWSVNWNSQAPLLRTSLPKGTHIFEANQSWDMKEDWETCFPKGDLVLCLVLTFVGIPLWVSMDSGSPEEQMSVAPWATLFALVLIWGMFVNVWFYRREPVRGTKFAMAAAAFHAVNVARHAEEHQRQMAQVPQWPGHDPNHQPYAPIKRTPGQPFVGPGGYWYAYDEWGVMSLTTPPEKRT